ncbi:MAG: c-type cytochrome [Candidatus Limnocylindria bacterium]
MRLKTLGVILISGLAIFTLFYWLTDSGRLEASSKTQEEEQLAYGKEMFGPATNANPATANCARCHGPEGKGGPVPGTKRLAPNLHSSSIATKLKVNPDYVHLVISYGGVVVSGDVNSPMPAWSTEVGGPLTVQQVDALTALVTSWAQASAGQPAETVPNTVQAGQAVYSQSGCAGCHGADLSGVSGPNIQNIGAALVTALPNPPSGLAAMQSDYKANKRTFLEKWIRDSATNYNKGQATGMPPHPEGTLSKSQLDALITFLLAQKK